MLPGTTDAKTGTYSQDNFGAIGAEAADAVVPASFVADTLNVYFVPMVKPVTTHDSSAPVGEHVFDSGVDVTVYFEIARPPLSVGAVHVT
jgi:adenine/guanine phosphoribosyltransferase-like PRPP-binding protein